MSLKRREDIAFYAKMAQHKLGLVSGQIELTSKCFQRCTGCESWRDDLKGVVAGCWEIGDLVRLFEELRLAFPTFEHLSFTGGDPQAHPQLQKLLQLIADNRAVGRWTWEFQVSTALTQDVPAEQRSLWHRVFHDVRISLDAGTTETYKKIRNAPVHNDPGAVIERALALAHPRTSFIMTVFEENVHEMALVARRLHNAILSRQHRRPGGADPESPWFRRLMVLPALGNRRGDHALDYWQAWKDGVAEIRESYPELNLAAGEDSCFVQAEIAEAESKKIPCRVGNVAFHLKADGAYYPCCLVGGEALHTHPQFRLGNFKESSLSKLYGDYVAELHYRDSPTCQRICQYKQFMLNKLTADAATTNLAMP